VGLVSAGERRGAREEGDVSTAPATSFDLDVPDLGVAAARVLAALRDEHAAHTPEARAGHPLRVFACGHEGMEETAQAGDAVVLLCPRCRADWRAGRGFVEVVRLFTPRA
jgi:hypothetical protein